MSTAQSRAEVREEQSHEALLELVCQHFHMLHVTVHVFNASFYPYLHKIFCNLTSKGLTAY